MLVTPLIIPYRMILHPHMGPPTTPGPQDPTIYCKSGAANTCFFSHAVRALSSDSPFFFNFTCQRDF